MTAHEQAYRVGQAWEALPEPKKQITFYVVSPNGEAQSFHIGPHAPSLQADDVELVHRLWLNFRRDPEMQNLHHSDIVTHALTRLAAEYARDKQETLLGLRRRVQDGTPSGTAGRGRAIAVTHTGSDYGVRAPQPDDQESSLTFGGSSVSGFRDSWRAPGCSKARPGLSPRQPRSASGKARMADCAVFASAEKICRCAAFVEAPPCLLDPS